MFIVQAIVVAFWIITALLSYLIIKRKPIIGIGLTVIQYIILFGFTNFMSIGFCVTIILSFCALLFTFLSIQPKTNPLDDQNKREQSRNRDLEYDDFLDNLSEEEKKAYYEKLMNEQYRINFTSRKKRTKQYDEESAAKMKLEDPLQFEMDIMDPESNAWEFEKRDERGNLI